MEWCSHPGKVGLLTQVQCRGCHPGDCEHVPQVQGLEVGITLETGCVNTDQRSGEVLSHPRETVDM